MAGDGLALLHRRLGATSIGALVTPSSAVAPASVTLSVVVTAAPDPVTVTQVEYFNGTTPLGVASGAPFSLNLSNLAAGTYAIVARATLSDPQSPALVSAPTPLKITGAATAGATVYYIQTDQLGFSLGVANLVELFFLKKTKGDRPRVCPLLSEIPLATEN